MESAPARTKLWYLKNLDIFGHLRDEGTGHEEKRSHTIEQMDGLIGKGASAEA